MSLKMKLTSAIVMFMLILSTLVIGVIAAESQTIKLYGNVTFNVNDTSLFVKSVSIRQSETDDYVPLDDFLPGYVDENMNVNLGPHEISYSSFSLRFDVINRTAETYVAGGVTLPSSLSSQVSASASGTINPTTKPLGSNNMADISITDDPDGQIIVTVTSTIAQTINLEGITVSIILQPEVLEGYTFSGNTLTGYTGSDTEITIPSSYSIYNDQFIKGNDFEVTTIGFFALADNLTVTKIVLPDSITNISEGAISGCENLTTVEIGPNSQLQTIERNAFRASVNITSIRIPKGVTSANIDSTAFFGVGSGGQPLEITIDNADVYVNLTGPAACGNLLYYAPAGTSIRILNSIITSGATNSYIDQNYINSGVDMEGYVVFTKMS